jgi:hypothetical protein
MSKQTFTTGQILTAAQMTTLQANDYNQTVNAKVASYTLVATDAGTRITMSNASATTITVNTALFTAGDTLIITNIGAGVCTITAGTATVSSSGSLALAQYDSGILYFSSTSAAIWNGANPGDITGVTAGTGLAGGGTSGTVTLNNTMATEITAKGDLIVGTGVATFDNLAAGSNGETLIADSSTSTGLRYQGSFAGGKNGAINGGFDIWQRGTSFTASSAYTADRWNTGGNTGFTYSQQLPGSTLPQFKYCMRLQRTNGQTTTAWLQIANTFETSESLKYAGKTVVVSFWARKSATFTSTNSRVSSQFNYGTGTDQRWDGFTGSTAAGYLDATVTTSWQRFSYTATVPTTATEVYVYFAITDFAGTAGASDYAEIAGVQVELGSVATEFSRAGGTLQGELAAAQRYYYRQSANATNLYQRFSTYVPAASSTQVYALIPTPVTMRTTPTSVDSTTSGMTLGDAAGGFVNVTSIALDTTSAQNLCTLTVSVASGLTTYRPYALVASNSATPYIGLSAEL